jgi:hypothetical protein
MACIVPGHVECKKCPAIITGFTMAEHPLSAELGIIIAYLHGSNYGLCSNWIVGLIVTLVWITKLNLDLRPAETCLDAD